MANNELSDIVKALGCGIDDDFDASRLRYHKIILLMDADSDGHHIATLLLTFLFRYMRPLIEQGYVYLAQPPLYRIQTGRKIDYTYSEEEKDEYLANLSSSRNPSIQRYKGLGEMNPDQLWETTLDPTTRQLLRGEIDDEFDADQIFTVLMGDAVEPRREFINENALSVQNLDV